MKLDTLVIVLAVGLATAAIADPSAEPMRGKLVFLRCASCHDTKPGASPRIGPSLHGVFGRQVASVPGYSYSASLKSQTFIWDGPMIDRWITKPTDIAPGTSMAFAGIASPADRKALIDYLAQATK